MVELIYFKEILNFIFLIEQGCEHLQNFRFQN